MTVEYKAPLPNNRAFVGRAPMFRRLRQGEPLNKSGQQFDVHFKGLADVLPCTITIIIAHGRSHAGGVVFGRFSRVSHTVIKD